MPVPKKLIKEIESIEDLVTHGEHLLNLTIQNLDIEKANINWDKVKIANTTFLGCDMTFDTELKLRGKGAIIYPKLAGLPYNPYRKTLYTWQELMEGYDPELDQSRDLKIYNHFLSFKYSGDINEALAERIHDHAIDDALYQLVGMDEKGMTAKKCVGIMGGHGVKRTEDYYEKVAVLTKKLTEEGFFVMSGGGPGIMEAANLGAYLAGKSEDDLKWAIETLKKAPSFKEGGYIEQAQEVVGKFSTGEQNLAIPTWFYGHEPSNLFATSIAKYFSNAIREDVLLASALYGIIYAPGSAGTVQEIFTEAAQNHYGSFGYISPMVFLGKKHWSEDVPLFQLLTELAKGKKYGEMLAISDEVDEMVQFIKAHPPVLNEQ